jgi:2Fe-2S ferredoxin
MPIVRFLPDHKTVQVRPGTTLLDAAGRAKAAVRTRCGGKASCLQCRVTVAGDPSGLSLPTEQERRKLGEEALGQRVRLACQAAVLKDVTAVIPEDPLKAAVRAQLERLRKERKDPPDLED